MKITVIGAGNGGKAVAADITLAGHEVTLFEFPATDTPEVLAKFKQLYPVTEAGKNMRRAPHQGAAHRHGSLLCARHHVRSGELVEPGPGHRCPNDDH